MQPETARQRPPDPWPFSPVHGSGDPFGQPAVQDGHPTAPHGHPTAPHGHPTAPHGHPTVQDGHPTAQDQARADTDELVARLRARRSTAGVAAAYAAAHGHPTDPRAEQGTRRWALTGTTAVVAVVAVLLLGVGVAVVSMRGDGVESLAPAPAGAESAGGSASPFAESDPAPAASGPGSAGSAPAEDPASGTEPAAGLLVHVVGQVAKPGLVTLPDGARVADALEAAGGVTGKADLTVVNLARAVADGEQLYVPKPGEAVPAGPAEAPGAGGQGTGGQSPPGGSGDTIDLNAADAVALEGLPGVGPSIAQAIVEWRDANGPFASVDELEDVPGIGPATLEEIRDSARVGP